MSRLTKKVYLRFFFKDLGKVFEDQKEFGPQRVKLSEAIFITLVTLTACHNIVFNICSIF